MRSLLVNSPDVASGSRDRVVIVTGQTSSAAKQQLIHDGVRVLEIPQMTSPYTHDPKYQSRFSSVMTKLYIFNMTQYQRLVFIDADALVLNDLSPLFSCGDFCAAFINPCHFNTGVMQVTPNTTLFNNMIQKLPHLPSYDGGDQGFLNSYFSHLLDAPMFDPKKPPQPRNHTTIFTRLPFSWHVDHSAYFPTFNFEFQKTDRCGPPRLIEWLGPPAGKPWFWWNYSVLDLSWVWYGYRKQLRHPYPPGVPARPIAILVILVTYFGFLLLDRCFRPGAPSSNLFMRVFPRLCPFKKVSPRMSCFFPILGGLLLWLVGLSASVLSVPEVLTPYWATAVFVHTRIFSTLLVLLCVGCVFCIGQREGRKGFTIPPTNTEQLHTAFRKTLGWATFEGLYLIVWTAITWHIAFPTMWRKAITIATVIVTEFVLLLVMLAKTSLMWLSVADSFDELSAYRSIQPHNPCKDSSSPMKPETQVRVTLQDSTNRPLAWKLPTPIMERKTTLSQH